MSITMIAYLHCGNNHATGVFVSPLYFCFFSSPFSRNSLLISVKIPNLLLTVGMLFHCLFIALALLGLSLLATTAPSPQTRELGDTFLMNDDMIPSDPNPYIPTNPYTPTDPVFNAQIDGFSIGSSFEFNSPTEPVILAQISDQGVVPNPDYGEGDPDIEAGGTCRKSKNLYCCKGQYNSKTQRVAQPCKLCTRSAFSSPQVLCFRSKHIIHTGRTEEAIFCNHSTFYCCQDLDVGYLSRLYSVE